MLRFSDILEHNNSNYAIVDANNAVGGHHQVSNKAARNAIPEDKRAVRMLVSYEDGGENFTKKFIGASVIDAVWTDDLNWLDMATGNVTPGIDTVLAQDQDLTDTRAINAGDNQFKIERISGTQTTKTQFGGLGPPLLLNFTDSSTSQISTVSLNTTDVSLSHFETGGDDITLLLHETTGAQLTDAILEKGFVYAADYSAVGSLLDRWIPDYAAVKAYADSLGIDDVLSQDQALIAARDLDVGANQFRIRRVSGDETSLFQLGGFGINALLQAIHTDGRSSILSTKLDSLSLSHTDNSGQGFAITFSNTSAIFSDVLNSKGFEYAADYSTAGTADPRWIPDWLAVTSQIGGNDVDALIITPTVSEDGYVVAWNNTNSEYELVASGGGATPGIDTVLAVGQTLTEKRSINMTTPSEELKIDQTTGALSFFLAAGQNQAMIKSVDTNTGTENEFKANAISVGMTRRYTIPSSSGEEIQFSDANGMLVSDSRNSKGLVYNADYSTAGTADDRWIPDYAAVTDYADSVALGAGSGLTENTGNSDLGGALTGVTTIGELTNEYAFTINNYLALQTYRANGFGNEEAAIYLSGSANYATIGITNSSSDVIWLTVNDTDSVKITDNVNSFGMMYQADYSTAGTAEDRWIPDYAAVKTYSNSYFTGALTDGTPTNAEIVAILGTAVSNGAGYKAVIKDSTGTGLIYFIATDGTNYYYTVSIQAV